MLFLLFVSVIPWPTALAAEYGRQAGHQPVLRRCCTGRS